MPYRLAIPQLSVAFNRHYPGFSATVRSLLNDFLIWLGYEDSNLGMPESESGALPLGDTPTNCLRIYRCVSIRPEYGGYDGIRTCDPIIMSDVL